MPVRWKSMESFLRKWRYSCNLDEVSFTKNISLLLPFFALGCLQHERLIHSNEIWNTNQRNEEKMYEDHVHYK